MATLPRKSSPHGLPLGLEHTLNWLHRAEERVALALTPGQVFTWRSLVRRTILSSTKPPLLSLPTQTPNQRTIAIRIWTITSIPTQQPHHNPHPPSNRNPGTPRWFQEYPHRLRSGPAVTMPRQQDRWPPPSLSGGVLISRQHQPPLLVPPHRGQGHRLQPELGEIKLRNKSQRVLVQTSRQGQMAW